MSEVVQLHPEQMSASEIVRRNMKSLVAWRGWTQAQFGALVGVGRNSVSDRERGIKPWTVDEIQRAADVLGVPIVQLFERPDSEGWAPRGSNPQPTDYEPGQLAAVLAFPLERVGMSVGSFYDQAEQADNVLPFPRPVESTDLPTVDDLVSAVERAEYHARLQQLRAERAETRNQQVSGGDR